jgi:20S proteasome alpha/beta subunit
MNTTKITSPERFLLPRKPFDFRRRPPYPPLPKRVVRGRKVTIAAAFPFREGAVICADSEMTHGDALKDHQEKVHFCYNDAVTVTLAGAGDDEYIKAAFHKIAAQINPSEKAPGRVSDVEAILERVATGIYKKSVAALPPEQRFGAGFDLLVAVTAEDSRRPRLFKVGTAVAPLYGFDAIGTGGPLAKYASEGLHEPTLSLSRAIILASYAVYVAKGHAPKVGGHTSIAVVTENGAAFDWDREIYATEASFDSFDSKIKPLFLACADEQTSESEYRQQVELFVQELGRMREHKKRFPELDSLPL